MNWTPSNWGTETFEPKGDSGWHLAASTTVENENEESLLLRDKEGRLATATSRPHTCSSDCGRGKGCFENRAVHLMFIVSGPAAQPPLLNVVMCQFLAFSPFRLLVALDLSQLNLQTFKSSTIIPSSTCRSDRLHGVVN